MIKQTDIKGQNAYYKAEAISDITEEAIRGGFSAAACAKLIFSVPCGDIGEYETLKKNIPDAYSARIQYRAAAGQFILPPCLGEETAVAVMPGEISFIRELYLRRVMEFYEEWKPSITPDRIAFSRDVAQYRLLPENSLCLVKQSSPVGLTTVYEREEPGTYCLNWIWFSTELAVHERSRAHYLTVEWLAKKGRAIDAFVDSFNFRSIRFFRKTGFSPVCLHITKKSFL
ncbi:MAG: hypothetical protein HY952_05230 [Elusimicrobia bacterium]|nr:hypothetical protein [Elusimicrobiota bacterium]